MMSCIILYTTLMFNLSLGNYELIETKECTNGSIAEIIEVSKYRGIIVDLDYDEHSFQMNVKDAVGELK